MPEESTEFDATAYIQNKMSELETTVARAQNAGAGTLRAKMGKTFSGERDLYKAAGYKDLYPSKRPEFWTYKYMVP